MKCHVYWMYGPLGSPNFHQGKESVVKANVGPSHGGWVLNGYFSNKPTLLTILNILLGQFTYGPKGEFSM